jgi:hypothetical protein
MLQRVILHVGPSKTGTTAIQGALSALSDELRSNGILYPETSPPSREGQPSLAWEILESIGAPVARLSKARLSWAEALRSAEHCNAHTLLISSEDFTLEFFERRAFAALRQVLADVPITVVFAVRDPVTAVPSMWQQAVKWGVGLGEEILDIDDAVPLILKRDRIQVLPYLETVQEALTSDIRVFTVPSRAGVNLLLRRFAEAVALPSHLIDRFCDLGALQNANVGISYSQIQSLLRLNRIIHALDPIEARYPRSGAENRLMAREAFLRCLPSDSKTDIPLSPGSFALLINTRENIIKWLAQRPDLIGTEDDLISEPNAGSPPAPMDSSAAEDFVSHHLVNALAMQTNRLSELYAYLSEVEKARDWWKATSESWERAARAGSEG